MLDRLSDGEASAPAVQCHGSGMPQELSSGARPKATPILPQNTSPDAGSGSVSQAAPVLWGAREWRSQLSRLEHLDLPLLGVGADRPGERGKRKAPASLRDGSLLSGWPKAKNTWQQISNACTKVIACGTRTGKAAHGLLAFDLDGASAVSWCLARGCDPAQARTWQIHRNTDANRLKVLFQLSDEQQRRLGEIKRKHVTKASTNDQEKSEAVELFHQGSSQVIVLGRHWESKGHYFWPDGMGPEDLAPIPECWWGAALELSGVNSKPPTSPAPRLQPLATELPARSEADLLKALERVPEFRHDEGRRDELLGLAMRLTVEWGAEEAHAWLAKHSPTIKDLAGYFNTAPTQISPGSIWPFLSEHYGVSLKRNDLKRPEHAAAPATTKAAPERPPASLQALIQRLPDGWSDHGKPRTLSPGALAEMLPALRFRFNDLDLRAQVETSSGWQRITDADLDSAYVLLTGKGWKIGADPVVKAILHVARQNTIHPVQDYLQRVKVDPAITPYDLDQVAPNLFRASQPLHVAMVRKWLIGAVARALNPGCQMDYCLVLQGAQGLLKSTSLKALASGDWFSSSHADQEKDFLLNVHSCWIYELAELESITGRKAAGALKNLITTATDSFRPPYGRTLERHHRQSVFCATVNKDQFLRDDTGNRRFWVVPIEGTEQLDRDAISAARDAIWKAAVLAHEAGELPMLSNELEALSAEQNEQFNEQDPWIGMVRAWMDGDPLHRWDPERDPSVARFDPAGAFTSAEILYSAGLKRTDAISRTDEMRVGEVLRALGFKRDKNPVTTALGRVRMWRPAPCTTCTTCTTSDFEVVHPENPSAASDLTPPAQPAQPKSPTGRLKSEEAAEPPLPVSAAHAHSHEGKKVVQVVQPAQTDCGAKHLSCTTSDFEVVQVVQEVVQPPLTRSPQPIGSGADVMDDGDDPHWPKRPEPSPAGGPGLAADLKSVQAQRAAEWEVAKADAKAAGCKPERVQRFKTRHKFPHRDRLTAGLLDLLREEIEADQRTATGEALALEQRLQRLRERVTPERLAVMQQAVQPLVTLSDSAARDYLANALELVGLKPQKTITPKLVQTLQQLVPAAGGCPLPTRFDARQAVLWGAILRLSVLDTEPPSAGGQAFLDWCQFTLIRQHGSRVSSEQSSLGDLMAGRMQAGTARQLLDLPPAVDLTTEAINSAYRAQAKQHHPDAGGDAGKFQRLSEARDRLLLEVA